MASPKENASYSNGVLNVVFDVTVDDPNPMDKYLILTTYQGDWMQENKWLTSDIDTSFHFYPYNFSITGIPFGEHTVNFTTNTQCTIVLDNAPAHYEIEKTVSVKFFMFADPVVTFLSIQNATSKTTSFPLNFTVDHPIAEMAYNLDGKGNLPINGNTTLAGLSNGKHNVTLCATDQYGYAGTSDSLFFYVDAPQFSLPLVAVVVISIILAVAAIGEIVFRRKNKQNIPG